MNRHAAGPDIRPISRQEFPEFFRLVIDAFGAQLHDSDRENDLLVFEPERSLAVFDGGRIVGTATAFSREITAPGTVTPFAAVSMVAVGPTHRRRGHLTAMMRRQLTELFEAEREPIAALRASEATIYGRFGYAPAAWQARLSGHTRRLRLRPGTDVGSGQVRLAGVEEARPHLDETYQRARSRNVGWLNRDGRWWDYRLYDAEHLRHGATPLRILLHEDGGQVTGYALYRTRPDWSPSEPHHEVRVTEVVACTPVAYAAIWSFLLDLDLVRTLNAYAPADEPLRHLLTDPRGLETCVDDNLWVRVADVGRALAARHYAHEIDVVLDVSDEFCPWNAGRWRLSGGVKGATCSRTADPADIALGSSELAAAYLGGTPLSALQMAGRVGELRGGAVAAASTAFLHHRAPFCPEPF